MWPLRSMLQILLILVFVPSGMITISGLDVRNGEFINHGKVYDWPFDRTDHRIAAGGFIAGFFGLLATGLIDGAE